MTIFNTETPPDEKDLWRTPGWLFRWLNARFAFDVDLAADRDSAVVGAYYSEAALQSPWSHTYPKGIGYLNPPYSNIDPWVWKAIEEMRSGFTTVMVMPSPNGEDRFADVLAHASETIDIVGRVAFIRPNGKEVRGNTRGTSVYIFDQHRIGAPCQRWWVSRRDVEKKWSAA